MSSSTYPLNGNTELVSLLAQRRADGQSWKELRERDAKGAIGQLSKVDRHKLKKLTEPTD